jgi:hypothetical protein
VRALRSGQPLYPREAVRLSDPPEQPHQFGAGMLPSRRLSLDTPRPGMSGEDMSDQATRPFQPTSTAVVLPAVVVKDRRPKLLVCHDMMGGYLADRHLQGATPATNEGEKHSVLDAYTLYRFDLIDIFVYFSHSLVTIPPLGTVRPSPSVAITHTRNEAFVVVLPPPNSLSLSLSLPPNPLTRQRR